MNLEDLETVTGAVASLVSDSMSRETAETGHFRMSSNRPANCRYIGTTDSMTGRGPSKSGPYAGSMSVTVPTPFERPSRKTNRWPSLTR